MVTRHVSEEFTRCLAYASNYQECLTPNTQWPWSNDKPGIGSRSSRDIIRPRGPKIQLEVTNNRGRPPAHRVVSTVQ
ncbi:hypothetical protein EC9_50110 [Rosistilla ulvae]|uniref:Uncharacterized protein n=1 Tax=Rosistilla ulvae TaxID=1930277 RepID=A0A517M7D3_9BACT|nr:hypothetical protein EC9_50110 [Rosistilla ulvae]